MFRLRFRTFLFLQIMFNQSPFNMQKMSHKQSRLQPAQKTPPKRHENRQETILPKKDKSFLRKVTSSEIYGVTFILLLIFCVEVYGEVFRRTAEENFITTDSTAMKFLLDQPWGWLFWLGRWGLLLFKNKFIGSIFLSAVLTLIVILTDKLCHVPVKLKGISIIIPLGILGWAIGQGVNLYHKNEPSLIILLPCLTLLTISIIYIAVHFIFPRKEKGSRKNGTYLNYLFPVTAFALLTGGALHFGRNDILTARMQNRLWQADWSGMIEDGQSSKRPTRATAAYHAIGLVQTGQLLENMFDIPYDFPDSPVRNTEGQNEYNLFEMDCNFYAGLTNAAYRCGMDHIVMNGPSLYYLKRMALCAILNNEENLADKYLALIGKTPFENDFVEKYKPMVSDRNLVEADDELARVLSLTPMESHFEQQYMQPAFLGYNAGLTRGSNPTLETAIAARLYSKDLSTCYDLIQSYKQLHNGVLPQPLQQVLTIMAQKNPIIQQAFPDIVNSQEMTLQSFFTAAKPIIDERAQASAGKSDKEKRRLRDVYNAKMREQLKADWLGTYYYYYYCENNDQDQIRPATKNENGGVN